MTNEDNLLDPSAFSLDINKIKQNISKYTVEKLCDMIVCDRYFGFGKELTTLCMEELAARRVAGDQFAFEDYIEKAYNELPVLDFSIPDIRSILTQAIGRKISK